MLHSVGTNDLNFSNLNSIGGSGFSIPVQTAHLPFSMNALAVGDYQKGFLGDGFTALVAFEALSREMIENKFGIDLSKGEVDIFWDEE